MAGFEDVGGGAEVYPVLVYFAGRDRPGGALEDTRWRALMMTSCAFVEGPPGETTHSLALTS
jgi:hypothetical protein